MIVNRVIFFCLVAIVVPEISGLFTRNIKEKFKKQLHIHDHHHHHHHHHNKHLAVPQPVKGNRHHEAHGVFETEKPSTVPPFIKVVPPLSKPKSSTTTTTTTTKTTTTQETTTNPTTTSPPTTTETTTEITTTELPVTEEPCEETTQILDQEQHYKHLKQVYVVNKNLKQEIRKGFLNTPTPPRKPLRFITTEKPMLTSRKPHMYQMLTNIPIIHSTTKKHVFGPDPFANNKIVSTSIINYFNNNNNNNNNNKPKHLDHQRPHDHYKNVEDQHQHLLNDGDYYKNVDDDQSHLNYYDYYKNLDHYKSLEEHHDLHHGDGDEFKPKPLHYDDYNHVDNGIFYGKNTYGGYGSVQNDHWNSDSKDTKGFIPKMKKSKINYTINYDNYEKNKKYGGHFSYPPPSNSLFLEEQHHLHLHRHKHSDGERPKIFNPPRKFNKDNPDTSYSASYFKLWS